MRLTEAHRSTYRRLFERHFQQHPNGWIEVGTEGFFEVALTIESAMAEAEAYADQVFAYFHTQTGEDLGWVSIVFGNEPEATISDHVISDYVVALVDGPKLQEEEK